MVSFSINGVLQAEYTYNHRGQQAVRKLYGASPVTIHSVFGPDGNRIAEYNEATGALIREYVWLDGVPIAVREGEARPDGVPVAPRQRRTHDPQGSGRNGSTISCGSIT